MEGGGREGVKEHVKLNSLGCGCQWWEGDLGGRGYKTRRKTTCKTRHERGFPHLRGDVCQRLFSRTHQGAGLG